MHDQRFSVQTFITRLNLAVSFYSIGTLLNLFRVVLHGQSPDGCELFVLVAILGFPALPALAPDLGTGSSVSVSKIKKLGNTRDEEDIKPKKYVTENDENTEVKPNASTIEK